MKAILSLFISGILFVGCNSSAQDAVKCREDIKSLEDSLSVASLKLQPGEKLDVQMKERLINKLVHYYQSFPEDKYAPEYLDKLHMIAAGERDYVTAMKYADTLINNYKDYINRAMVLESMANAYDMFIVPRDTSKVRFYNDILLKENPEMDMDKRDEILYRMKHLDLTIDEFIDFQINSQMK